MNHCTMRMRLTLTTLVTAFLLATPRTPASAGAATLPRALDPLVQNMDPAARPGADFFRHACGRWMRNHPIPPTESSWGIGDLVREETYLQRRGICETAAASEAPAGSVDQNVGDFWVAGMDSLAVAGLGAAPLQPYLDAVAAISTRDDLVRVLGEFQRLGFGPVYSLGVGPDERNSDREALHLYQGGIGLPDRDYYFSADASSRHVREEYRTHLFAMFRLLGENSGTAQRSGEAAYRIERSLASRSRTLEQLRDPWANYHRVTPAGLDQMAPAMGWAAQFTAMKLAAPDSIVVGQPEFLALADSCVRSVPLQDWKAYLRWNVVGGLANRLSPAFEREHFRFYGTILNGMREMRPRWKRVIDAEERDMGELMGQAWVRSYCSPGTKARYERLTQDIIEAYRDRIRGLTWMSEATKARALDKLDHVVRKVAYPDHWRDFTTLRLDRTSYASNQVSLNRWWFDYYAARIGKPVDRTTWDMSPQTYNAYYEPTKNEIVLPAAAFMLPGVPDSLVDDAVLYSYAGAATIGHELTHGFDDEGRQFDAHGNLNPWWTESDSMMFNARATVLADQFDQYVVGDKHVRGRATLGENIADLGGVRLGYEAFKKTEQFRERHEINELTPDQRFFLGYALGWLGSHRPEELAMLIMSDVHSPDFLRVNGPLSDTPEFYGAFGIKPGDAMWRDVKDRVSIW